MPTWSSHWSKDDWWSENDHQFLLIIFSFDSTTLIGERKYKMFDVGVPELLIVLVIVVLVFGPGRLGNMMGEIGKGIRSFRESFSTDEKSDSVSDSNLSPK